MRRALFPLLFAFACSASPPPPLPKPSPPPAKPPAAQAAPRMPWLELTGTERATVLIGHDPSGNKTFEVPLGPTRAVIAASDGGAYAVVEEPTRYSPGKAIQIRVVSRLDAQGRETWKVRLEGGGWDWRLFATADRLYAFDLVSKAYRNGKQLHVFDAATGKELRSIDLAPEVVDVGGHGEIMVFADARGVSRLGPEGDPAWSIGVRLFPSMDPASERDPERKVAVGFDGTVLTGASDGSLLALSPEGEPLYQLGVPGAVSEIEPRADGDFVVRTSAGITTLVGPSGVVRRESAEGGEGAPPEAGRVIVIDKRKGKSKTDAPASKPWKPTIAYRAQREGPEGKPFASVSSVVAMAPDNVWVLGRGEIPASDESDNRLFHYDGRTWTDHGRPMMRFAKEVYAEGQPAVISYFVASSLARGPRDTLLVLGLRVGKSGRRLSVLERTDTGYRERRELVPTLAKIENSYEGASTYAVSASGHEVLCHGRPPTCVELGPGIPPRILPNDQGRRIPDAAEERQRADYTYEIPVLFAGETLWKTRGWAIGEAEMWGLDSLLLTHWNGTDFEFIDNPVLIPTSVWASARNDLWLTGREGEVAHFDGERWSRILGIRGGGLDFSVTGSGRGDVWVHGQSGLFHVTPEPQALPDLEGTPAAPPPASLPSRGLTIAGADPSYRLERVELQVDGGEPFRTALSIAEGPGGVLWLHDGARVVEHDGAHTRLLYQAPKPEPFVCWSAPEPDCEFCFGCTERRPRPFTCQRCVAPIAAGEGAIVTAEEGWLSIHGGHGGHASPGPTALSPLLALARTPSGAMWAVSAGHDDLPAAMIHDPRGPRLVAGLPPATYTDVAVRADNDVWLAGGLTSAEDSVKPEGEGTLVHFDGRAFTRSRAPDGALLSVATPGPGEAWAVGLRGGVLHAKAGAATAFHLEREGGARLPVILRGVAASGPNEVWMVGDGSTLLRWDGQALRRIDASAAGKEAALSAVIAPGAKAGWVVGPSGIWRVIAVRSRGSER